MNHNVQISAVILASGMSKRMGSVKQMLPFEGVSLLESIIRKLLPLPFTKIYAVIGHHAKEIRSQINIEDQRFEWILNERYYEGQSAALKTAAKSVNTGHGIMVFLADQPLILEETIKLVYHQAQSRLDHHEMDFVVQPSFSGQKGHPVFFFSNLIPCFELLKEDEGGKRIINQAQHHYIIPVEDPGILFDVDTPEDYQVLLRMHNSRT